MKAGSTLQDLAIEVMRRKEAKRDYRAPVPKVAAVLENEGDRVLPTLNLKGIGSFPLTGHAHQQLAGYLDIPKKHYDRLIDKAPGIWAIEANRWLDDHHREQRFVRTLDGKVRAFLSDRYHCMENEDLIEAIMPTIGAMNLRVWSCEITDRRLFLKVVDESVMQQVPTGAKLDGRSHEIFDVVSPGVVISNSEIGAGALSVESSVYTRACTNLAIWGQGVRKYHAGARASLSDDVYEVLSDRTREVTDEATWRQIADYTRAAFDEAQFAAKVDKLKEATEDPIEGKPSKVLEVAQKRFSWTDTERESVLSHLIRGGDLSRYGLSNAVTRTAEDLDDYERATEFERLGGDVIELSPRDWQRLSEAA